LLFVFFCLYGWGYLNAGSLNCLIVGLIVPEILRCIDFGALAWKCLFTPPFFWGGAVFGHIFGHPSFWPPRGPSLQWRKHVRHLSHSAEESVQRFDMGAGSRKKGQDNKQEVKVIWQKAPHGGHPPVRGHPRGSKVVPLWIPGGRVSY